jgi:hypothetical protein
VSKTPRSSNQQPATQFRAELAAVNDGDPLVPCILARFKGTVMLQAIVYGHGSGQFRPAKGAVRVTCRRGVLDMGPNLAVSLLALSQAGACLAVGEALAPGREVSVGLTGPGYRRPMVCVGRVVWSAPAADRTHHAGVVFHDRLPYRELVELSREPAGRP